MRINSVQANLFNQHNSIRKVSARLEAPVEQPKEQVSFKGGKGGLIGFCVGVLGSAAAAIATGGLAIPAIVATYGAMGVGVGTAYVGHKIEEKITGEDKK